MFFDSVNMLAENFFSREIMFIFGLTYLFFEINRGVIILLNTFFPLNRSIRLRILIQYIVAMIASTAIVSLVLFLYFRYVEGFTTINTELITFNLIYLFTAVFYHLFYLSMVFLYKRNDRLVEQEIQQKTQLELELNAFRNQVNPEFLFQSLETVISTLYDSKKEADNLIDNLAKTYRYTLDNRHNELVSLKDELDALNAVVKIYEKRFPGALKVEKEISNQAHINNLVPCTLTILLEKAVTGNIISRSLPLTFSIIARDQFLVVGYNQNMRLRAHNPHNTRMEFLEKAYGYFSTIGLSRNQNSDFVSYKIPLIKIEEE
jgi:LytS/YehU family sensor histidine kinase